MGTTCAGSRFPHISEPHVARRLPTKQFGGPPTEGIVARGRSVDLVRHDAEPEIAGYSMEEKRYIIKGSPDW